MDFLEFNYYIIIIIIMEHSWIQGLHEPAGIIISNDFIYVSSVTRSLIYKINCKDGSYESWKPIFSFCNSLASYKNQYLYACSFMETTMEKISLETENTIFCYSAYNQPYGITIAENTMYVSNQNGNFISKFNLETYDPENQIMPWINLSLKPYSLVLHDTYLYISHYDDNCISCINIVTNELHESIITDLHGPLGMAIDSNFLYIANKLSGNISLYNCSFDPFTPLHIQNEQSNSCLSHINLPELSDLNEKRCKPILINESYIIGLHSPYGLAIQQNYMYVTNFDSGTIGKIQLYQDKVITEIEKEEPILIEKEEPILKEKEEPNKKQLFIMNKRKWYKYMVQQKKLASLVNQQKYIKTNKVDINRIDPSPFIRYTNII